MHALDELIELGKRMDQERGLVAKLAQDLLKVRDRHGSLVKLQANAAQLQFERTRTQQNIVLKARQMGMTTWIAARFFLRTITHPGTLTVQVAQSQAAVEALFRIVQRLWQQLPDELRQGPLKRSRANVGQMIFPALDSEFRVWSAGDRNAGRGLSVQNLHCSEVSRWQGDAAETLAGLRAALAPGGELVLESTPNGAQGAFYNEWQAGVLTQHFLPWWMEPEYIGPRVEEDDWTDEECKLVFQYNLKPNQIGFRRHLQEYYGRRRSQEFAEDPQTCFRATGSCYFESENIEERLTETDATFQRRRNGALEVYWPPQPTRDYLVAVDTAGGGDSGDFAAVQVIDRETGMQCAELQERLRPIDLARVSAELAREYGNALVVVERNNHGPAVLAYLDQREKYERLYQQGDAAGFLTNVVTKPEMLSRLAVLLVQRPALFQSRRLLGECRTFLSSARNKLGAARGSHDDLVMAMAIAQEVRAEPLTVRGLRAA